MKGSLPEAALQHLVPADPARRHRRATSPADEFEVPSQPGADRDPGRRQRHSRARRLLRRGARGGQDQAGAVMARARDSRRRARQVLRRGRRRRGPVVPGRARRDLRLPRRQRRGQDHDDQAAAGSAAAIERTRERAGRRLPPRQPQARRADWLSARRSARSIRTSPPPATWTIWRARRPSGAGRHISTNCCSGSTSASIDLRPAASRSVPRDEAEDRHHPGADGARAGLILDEPTAGLDPLMVQAFRETLDVLRAPRRHDRLPVLARAGGGRERPVIASA